MFTWGLVYTWGLMSTLNQVFTWGLLSTWYMVINLGPESTLGLLCTCVPTGYLLKTEVYLGLDVHLRPGVHL